jgi:4-amino-4-deoxy-L-arabinose transferase-like glycosyltransferase
MVRFLDRESQPAPAGLWLVAVTATTPLLAVGSLLLTIDPLSVFFWTAAMMSGWYAIRHDSTRAWVWTGIWMGLGTLAKYVNLLQWLSWIVFACLWKPARTQWRRPGPWIALVLNLTALLPVIAWNAQHDWITLTHLGERGGLSKEWAFSPRFLLEFIGSEVGLLNPVFFCATLWACIHFWKHQRNDPLRLLLFSMGVPLVLVYFAWTFRSRVLPNWIAPAVIPLLTLAVLHCTPFFHSHRRLFLRWLRVGVGIGIALHLFLILWPFALRPFPAELASKINPLRRITSWTGTADLIERHRAELASEGPAVFIIGDHYGITAQLSFYMDDHRKQVPSHPDVYCITSDRPRNQFWFWPNYLHRKGQNALFIRETHDAKPPPRALTSQFATVRDLGTFDIIRRGYRLHRVQIFECRDLR